MRLNILGQRQGPVASTFKSIGGTYLEANDPVRAAKYLKKALEIEKHALKSSWSMHLSVQLCINIYACIRIYVNIYTNACIHTCMRKYIRRQYILSYYIRIYIHTYMYIYMNRFGCRRCTCAKTSIHTYVLEAD